MLRPGTDVLLSPLVTPLVVVSPSGVMQCFFKVFKWVWWWSYRVPIQFFLLCLILLTDFHKNAHFRPNMLNYLNMTFTFGKQTQDNFINRKF